LFCVASFIYSHISIAFACLYFRSGYHWFGMVWRRLYLHLRNPSIFLAFGYLLNPASGTNQFLLELVVAAPGQWNYFEVRIDTPMCKLQISANPASGDPDLFVSTTLQRPNSTSCRAAPADTCVISDNVRVQQDETAFPILEHQHISHQDTMFSA
jgi:hypothetical protein